MPTPSNHYYTIAGLLRITLGWIFLWAFMDKAPAWMQGTSPTLGFLKNATSGPFSAIYHNLAGNVVVDWLFMLGLLGIGLALVLGIGMKIATYSGALLLLLLWSAVLPPKNNPVLDEHIIYLLALQLLYRLQAGQYLSLGKWWSQTALVQRYSWLQ